MPSGGKRLTLQQKDALRAFYKSKPTGSINLSHVCAWAKQEFGCEIHSSTAGRVVRDNRSHDSFSIAAKATTRRCNLKAPHHPLLDEQLASWIDAANKSNVCVTGPMLKQKARQLAIALGISDTFRASQGWLYKFQRRHNYWVHRLHGESASVDSGVASRGREELVLETQLYESCDIYNMDETAIFYRAQPKKSMSSKPISGLKMDKTRLSAALAANADGSHKLPVLFIGKAARPRCFGTLTSRDISLYYRSNRKAWMTVALFSEWITKVNEEMKRQNRRVLLLLDNASSHQVVRTDLDNVRVVMLPPNTTSVLQPMDAGIIATFKHYFKQRQLEHAIKIVDAVTSGAVVSEEMRKNPYAVDILQAMTWATESWNEISSSTIRNCWAHTGILPRASLMAAMASLRLETSMSLELLLC